MTDGLPDGVIPAPDPRNPVSIGLMFLSALTDPVDKSNDNLLWLTTPESHVMWGDFSDARALMDSIVNWGVGSLANPAVGDDSVRYMKVLPGVTANYQVKGDVLVETAAILTIVWRADHDRWMVHHLGREFIAPEHVPHGN
jgi:hypothetical protein